MKSNIKIKIKVLAKLLFCKNFLNLLPQGYKHEKMANNECQKMGNLSLLMPRKRLPLGKKTKPAQAGRLLWFFWPLPSLTVNHFRAFIVCFQFSILCLSGCYFHNTEFVPSPNGFHNANDFPLSNEQITGFAGNGEKLVAVSYEGNIAWSEDSGVSWDIVETGNITDNFIDGIHFNAVTYGNGFFLAAGDLGKAAYSKDGLNWQAGIIGPMSPKNILCVAAGALRGRPVFTAAGTDGRMAHAVDSPEGPWFMADQVPFGTAQDYGEAIHALAFGEIKGNGVFVAVGDNGRIGILKDL
ncbi:MAG: hypothetical protein FWH41_07790, partial [Treponema sp.]|nr:hypothetical protein [Treponema sp.]